MTLRLNTILGNASDASFAETLHTLEHDGRVEYLLIGSADLSRKRLRATTDKGTECAIALARSTVLEHGSLLFLDAERAIVVRLEALTWLVLEACDRETSLKLGFLAGHLHWRAKFDGPRIEVALDQDKQSYLDRLDGYVEPGSVRVLGDEV